jgi:hypothetical protein
VAVKPELESAPHPSAGVRLQFTPALFESLLTVALSVTAGLPASIVVVEPDWVTETLTVCAIAATESVTAAVLVKSAADVMVTVALQLLLSVAGGV